MPKARTHEPLTRTRQKHEERAARYLYPEIESDPELNSAYHSLQLHWLDSVPGYRERLKVKVSEAARQAEKQAKLIEKNQRTLYGERLGAVLKAQERDEQLERLAGY